LDRHEAGPKNGNAPKLHLTRFGDLSSFLPSRRR